MKQFIYATVSTLTTLSALVFVIDVVLICLRVPHAGCVFAPSFICFWIFLFIMGILMAANWDMKNNNKK